MLTRSGGAAGGVSGALFVDDDVLLLDNPFAFFDTSAFDFRHQVEEGSGCLARPNGGLLYVRATSAGLRLLANMVAKKDTIEASGDKLDQDYIIGAAEEAGASRCALPKSHFTGHCPRAHHPSAPMSDVVTYHTHCCGLHDSKLALLERIAYARRALPRVAFDDVDRVPLPGMTVVTDVCYRPRWTDLRGLRRAWARVDAALGGGGDGGGDGGGEGEGGDAAGGKRVLRGRLAGDILR